jgi:Tol biopolymer transport system component
MNIKLPLLTLFLSSWLHFSIAQSNTTIDTYKTEADGYFTTFLASHEGLVATDNFASRIYLFYEGKAEVLFSAPGSGRYMTLSADKKNIGFKYIRENGQQAPALLNIQNQTLTLLNTPVELCGQVSFSQNGKIAYTVGNELVVKYFSTENRYNLGQYVNIAPISPDGNFVCYNDDRDQLFLLNLTTNQTLKLTSGEKGNMYPQWSPDGSKLLYSSLSGELYIYDIQTQNTSALPLGHYASWTADSRYIVYTSLNNSDLRLEGSDIFKVKYDGSELQNLTNSPDNYEMGGIINGDKLIYQSLNYRTVSSLPVNGIGSPATIYQLPNILNMALGGTTQNSTQALTMVPGTVPYVNQVYDTPEWHYGYGSCAPTTSVMAAAYYNKIPKWPITTSNGVGSHTSNYGAYVATKYRLNQYYFDDMSTTNGGDNAYGGYGFMWTGPYSPSSKMQSYTAKHYMTSVQEYADNYSKVLAQINAGYPFPICNLLTSAGHLTLAIGYVNGQHTIVFHDPYGNKNTGTWPNWTGQNSKYDWPGYNNGFQNLQSVAWTVTAQGSEVAYNDTIIDDVFYNHGFYINNSSNGSQQGFYRDMNTGYNNHHWYTGTEAGTTDIAYVKWTPTINTAGNHQVYAYIPGGASSTATNAKYKVHHANGSTTVTINQAQNGGQWVSLGIFSLSAGQTNYVYLGDATGSSTQNIAFDAMKFRYVGIIDNTVPTTAVSAPNNWVTNSSFTATFTDADNNGGSGLEKSFYQVIDYDGAEWHANAGNGFFADNFDSYNTPVWSVPSGGGTWQVASGELAQTDVTAGNSNVYAQLNQNLSNRYLYHFIAKIDPAADGNNQHRFGLHFFSDNGGAQNRGNSYFIYVRQETSTIELYKVVNDVFTVVKTISGVATALGQSYDYKITFDRVSGKIGIYRDNALLGTWTDTAVLTTSGDYISFRTGNCKAYITELKVYRSRAASVTVSVGSGATNDIRYQNPNPTMPSGRVKSIVNDAAGNLSAIASENISVDWTAPACLTVSDGNSTDTDTTNSVTSLSASWAASTDSHSGVTKYWYAIGTSAGATDVVNWTDNNLNTSVTASGLALTTGQTYYISVKTENGAGVSSICSADGILADVTAGVEENENPLIVSAYPNPFSENTTLLFSQTSAQKITITLTDIVGKTILETSDTYPAGTNSVMLNTAELMLAKGVYTLRISGEKSATSVRLLKY